MGNVGLVVIGRNEGQRLRRCLESAAPFIGRAVYVDSGSTDGSVAYARSRGIEVVELDAAIPFTAARARNEGFARLLHIAPDTDLVQFVDGDCEIVASWWQMAIAVMEQRPELAIVSGRRRERFPERSPYNRLCDIEWNTPVGEADSCGGDSMVRVSSFREVGGFNAALIAGEEPEMCLRLREKGWKIERLDAEMTLHDAAMTRFSQWWRREKRTGFAIAEGATMHGKSAERYRVKMHRSNWLWGAIVPVLAIGLAWWTRGISLALLGFYPVQWLRIQASARRRGLTPSDARFFAAYLLLGKFPQVSGQLKYWFGRLSHRPSRLIEYKGTDAPPDPAQEPSAPAVKAGSMHP